MMERQFRNKADADEVCGVPCSGHGRWRNVVQQARELVHKSKGLEKTKQLAEKHCSEAVAAISRLPPSPAQQALVGLAAKVLNRNK